MTDETNTSPSPSTTTAGALLRDYRQAHGLTVDELAHTLHVSAAKLEALEADRFDDLPDTVFIRALALAVCRHLKADAAPVLALLPVQDASRFVPKDDRGLDFPLKRPSLLPQPLLLSVIQSLTPLRWGAVGGVLVLLSLLAVFWYDIGAWWSKPSASEPSGVTQQAAPAPQAASADTTQVQASDAAQQMVVTTVQSAALAQHVASSAAAPASAVPGASNAR